MSPGPKVPHGAPPLEAQVAGKLEALASMVEQIIRHSLPALDHKLEALRELLAARRKEHYVVEEVAELTGRSPYTIRRWVSEGKLQAIRLRDGGPRGKLLVPRSELERLVASGQGKNVPETALK
jgi:excisionase family DNA binding protein